MLFGNFSDRLDVFLVSAAEFRPLLFFTGMNCAVNWVVSASTVCCTGASK